MQELTHVNVMFDRKQPVTQALMDHCYSFIVLFTGALTLLCCATQFCVSYVRQGTVTVYVT